MVSASAEVSVNRLDERLITATLAELIRKWQLLAFDTDGVLLRDGTRVEGLHLTAGRHHRENARYEMAFTPDETKDESPDPVTLVILAAAQDRLIARAQTDQSMSVALDIENPTRPNTVSSTLEVALPDDIPLFSGPVNGRAKVDLATLKAQAGLKHRRALADAAVTVKQPNTNQSRIKVTIRLRGRGLLWLPVAIAGPFVRSRLRAKLEDAMNKVAVQIDSQKIGTLTASELADEMFDKFLASLAVKRIARHVG